MCCRGFVGRFPTQDFESDTNVDVRVALRDEPDLFGKLPEGYTYLVSPTGGEGEGEGEGEDQDFCAVFDTVRSEFGLFKTEYGISSEDFDAEGLPEEFALALVGAVCSLDESDSLRGATLSAYDINRLELMQEGDYEALSAHGHALATLLLLSQGTQDSLRDILVDYGIALNGTYQVVTENDGEFMPAALPGSSLEEGFIVFDAVTKSENEPYSATGDFDGDGASNLAEYNAVVIDGGGSFSDFVAAAGDPLIIGGEGEGEGEGPPPVCGALWKGGAPISGGAGDLALLILCLGAMLFVGRLKSSGV